jgi:integrase
VQLGDVGEHHGETFFAIGVVHPPYDPTGALGAAAQAIGRPELAPPVLRHTAASLAIAAGANVKVVQQMLGHASATMTLDLYGHLFEDQLDEVAVAMVRAKAAADYLRTKPAMILEM